MLLGFDDVDMASMLDDILNPHTTNQQYKALSYEQKVVEAIQSIKKSNEQRSTVGVQGSNNNTNDKRNWQKLPPLGVAILYGSPEVVLYLINRNPKLLNIPYGDINKKNKLPIETAAYEDAVSATPEEGCQKNRNIIVKLLLSKANKDTQANWCGKIINIYQENNSNGRVDTEISLYSGRSNQEIVKEVKEEIESWQKEAIKSLKDKCSVEILKEIFPNRYSYTNAIERAITSKKDDVTRLASRTFGAAFKSQASQGSVVTANQGLKEALVGGRLGDSLLPQDIANLRLLNRSAKNAFDGGWGELKANNGSTPIHGR